VALEVKSRLDQGLLAEKAFDLETLANRAVEYRKPFTCAGGREKCDLACSVSRIRIENKTYPFGGACNKYYNIRQKLRVDADQHDLVVKRQELVYDQFAPDLDDLPADAPVIGFTRSFLMSTYYPLFAHFFKELGFRPITADAVDEQGLDRCVAPFCYPCEIAHGFFHNLLDRSPDYIFLPHIKGTQVKNGYPVSRTCPLLQGEPYYLRRAFEAYLKDGPQIISPVIDLAADPNAQLEAFMTLARTIGVRKTKVVEAFTKARSVQDELHLSMLEMGREALRMLEKDTDRIGVVLFGRSYNAFIPEANKGIPHKFASRGITMIPVDFLDLERVPAKEHMYWSAGQINLKGAEFIKGHPQLFGTFITNFSCGPDSFIVGYFKDILGRKPSLILELDNHTADTGIETRIEAFLDIVSRYRSLQSRKMFAGNGDISRPGLYRIKELNTSLNYDLGPEISLFDPRLRVVFPSMGQYATQALAAVYRGYGINTAVLPAMDEEDLKLGRGNTTCKECLPLQLTTGALLKYLRDERPDGEITAYFMPTTDGPCRFGQYQDFMRDYIRNRGIENVTLLSISSRDSYGGLGTDFIKQSWNAAIISDIFEDLHNAMLTLADDPQSALEDLQDAWGDILNGLEKGGKAFPDAVRQIVPRLKDIPHKMALADAPQVLVVGEIYVRKEGLSRRWLPERLAERGFVVHVAPVQEWIYYVDWLVNQGLLPKVQGLKALLVHKLKQRIMRKAERTIKRLMARTGWYVPRLLDVDHIIKTGEQFLSPQLIGEAILTIGGPLAEVGEDFCGAIAIGPFGCMPNRLSESILNLTMDREHILLVRKSRRIERITREVPILPYLTIESDGNPFPQIIEARLETFILQAQRLHEVMRRYQAGN
ncbi:MAG: activase, partial [Calditrichaeota bacterium]|nr:activase [Calditrichota bacterium]